LKSLDEMVSGCRAISFQLWSVFHTEPNLFLSSVWIWGKKGGCSPGFHVWDPESIRG
jgi:hypothetical protein